MSTSRILDIPCKVCGDFSSGKHYNIFACDGCAGFFKRSIRKSRQYVCKAKEEGTCVIDKTHRNQCRACRLQKCQEAGMNKDAVQHERGPRNSTLRRQQMSGLFDDKSRLIQPSGALNLTVPKSGMDLKKYNFHPYPYHVSPPPPPQPQTSPIPLLMPTAMLLSSKICEQAANIVLEDLEWIKLVTHQLISREDQLVLLEECWKDLFILSAAWSLPIAELTTLAQTNSAQRKDFESFFKRVQDLQKVLMNVRQHQLDHIEMTCLRKIVFFRASFDKHCDKTLIDQEKLKKIQDETQSLLSTYIAHKYPGHAWRFRMLMLLLPTFGNVAGETIEELFFKEVLGEVSMVRAISDMYKKEDPSIFKNWYLLQSS